MTPKETADDLYAKFMWNPQNSTHKLRARHGALVAVDEILKLLAGIYTRETVIAENFYDNVKEEIQKL